MHEPPQSTEGGTEFDLGALERELKSEELYARNHQMARTLVRAADQRVVLMVLKAGARIAEHQADGTVSIQVLSGSVNLGLPTRSVELQRGGLLVLAPGLRHHVVASEESALLLTLGRATKS